MELSQELQKIKKVYGEKFMHLCRELFPTLLETEGKLFEILTSTFSNNSRTLYDDIENNGLEGEFKDYIYSKIDIKAPKVQINENKTPYELLDEAGYELYECTTEKQIQSFKKYYARDEELCTFNGGRLETCDVFFAVRKDVDEIKREDYAAPKRDDKYGTSVMGIQFYREGMCSVSIKNRYNHSVSNPDATYGNNLDRIIPGLEESFAKLLKERGLEFSNINKDVFEMRGYVVAGDGKTYKYNCEINGIYYCPGNIIIENGEVKQLKDYEILIDSFVLNTKEKTLTVYDKRNKDSFEDEFKEGINKIEVTKNKEKGNGIKTITIFIEGNAQPVTIDINQDNEIIGYENSEVKYVGDDFLRNSKALREISLPQLQKTGNDFLRNNWDLREINLPQLQKTGNDFLRINSVLGEINLPQLQKTGNDFLENNHNLNEINLPQLEEVGDGFLHSNIKLRKLSLPHLQQVGNEFLSRARKLNEINLPQLQKTGDDFLYNNRELRKINLPQLEEIGERYGNEKILRLIKSGRFQNIDSHDLAGLDKEAELTTSEVSVISRFFSKIKNVIKDSFER